MSHCHIIKTFPNNAICQDLCVEVGAPEVIGESEAGHNLTLSPGLDRVTLGWTASGAASTVR